MNNKVLVKLDFIDMNITFEIFIPVNEQVWKIVKLIEKSAFDLVGTSATSKERILINKRTGVKYENNSSIFDTDIRNGTELIIY